MTGASGGADVFPGSELSMRSGLSTPASAAVCSANTKAVVEIVRPAKSDDPANGLLLPGLRAMSLAEIIRFKKCLLSFIGID